MRGPLVVDPLNPTRVLDQDVTVVFEAYTATAAAELVALWNDGEKQAAELAAWKELAERNMDAHQLMQEGQSRRRRTGRRGSRGA